MLKLAANLVRLFQPCTWKIFLHCQYIWLEHFQLWTFLASVFIKWWIQPCWMLCPYFNSCAVAAAGCRMGDGGRHFSKFDFSKAVVLPESEVRASHAG